MNINYINYINSENISNNTSTELESNKTAPKIIIDLAQANRACTLKAEYFLQKKQYCELLKNISNILNKIKGFRESLDDTSKYERNIMGYERFHDVITLNGKRGTGKTTFLLSALGLLNNIEEFKKFQESNQTPYIDADSLCILNVMDPTLFTCKEHLLHAVLSQIGKKILYHSRKQRLCHYEGAQDECAIEKWRNELAKLAKGLKTVGEERDSFEHVESMSARWEDSEFILQNDIESIQHSMDLERAFHKIINNALYILKKEAFVLAIDDTDTRPEIAWHTLEVLRRYFTTPQLIVIISGDLDLFSVIIRQKKITSLNLSKNTYHFTQEFLIELVNNLTEQYLLKLFHSNMRIKLGNFKTDILHYEMKALNKIFVTYDVKNNKPNYTIEELINNLFCDLGCYNELEKQLFREALFKQPIRTVVQILDALYKKIKNDLTIHDFICQLCDVFFMQIKELGFSTSFLQEDLATNHGITNIIKMLLTRQHINAGLELLPNYDKVSTNQYLLVLQVNLVHAMCSNPQLIFIYLFKACILREVLIRENLFLSKNVLLDVHRYLRFGKEERLYITTKRISAMLWHNFESFYTPINFGTIRLSGKSSLDTPEKRKKMFNILNNYSDKGQSFESSEPEQLKFFNESLKKLFNASKYKTSTPQRSFKNINNINTFQTMKENILSWQSEISNLGILDFKTRQGNNTVYSVLSLLSFLGDIVRCFQGPDSKEILYLLNSSCLIDNFSIFKYTEASKQNEASKPVDNLGNQHLYYNDTEIINILTPSSANRNKNKKDKEIFAEMLKNWAALGYQLKPQLYTTLCARSMTRFSAALRAISRAYRKKVFLGEYIHRCLIAFFNSILIEEFLLSNASKDQSIQITHDNPVKSDIIFIENLYLLKFLSSKNEKQTIDCNIASLPYPFFSFIFSCPLWGLYLDPKSKSNSNENETPINDVFNIYKTFCMKINNTKDEDIEKILSVKYRVMSDTSIGFTIFDNLYYILNSVSIYNHTQNNKPNNT